MNARLTKQALGVCGLGAAMALVALTSLGTPVRATESTWSPDADCAVCHESQAASIAVPTHESLGCAICHSDEDALAKVHADVDGSSRSPRRLKTTDVPDATCLACHGDGMIAAPEAGQDTAAEKASEPAGADVSRKVADKQASDIPGTKDAGNAEDAATEGIDTEQAEPGRTALIAATAGCTVLTDEKGTKVNPHDLPPVEDHATVNCIDCHKGHSDDTLEDSATKACTLCHHENVFECYTCHE